MALPFDAADREQVRAGVDRVAAELGPVELLVSNHAFMSMGPFEREPIDRWWRNLEVNLLGTAWLLEEALPPMLAAGRGRVVAIASEWGITGWPEATGYAASKGGVVALVHAAGRALAGRGIAVNAVAPGVTDTAQLEVDARAAGVTRAEIVARYGAAVPAGAVGRPEEIAAVVAFLCSDAAVAFVGQVLQPNGGTTT